MMGEILAALALVIVVGTFVAIALDIARSK